VVPLGWGHPNVTAATLGDSRLDQLAEVRLEPLVCALLIRRHQARIACHVGGEDCGEAADRGMCRGGVPAVTKSTPKLCQP
jgi:hypothetical protein